MKVILFLFVFSIASFAAPSKSLPPSELGIYLVGIHPEKNNPMHQPVAHHYCHQVNSDFAQCVLYDGNTKTANLMGIEYIIPETVYETLAPEEKKYWHPHNYEILSGALSAPGLPAKVEKGALKAKMNSYGKTWHVWRTPNCCNGTALPLGEPTLGWSLNRDGEANPLALSKVKDLGINMEQKRKERADLKSVAKPQGGVDDLKSLFPAGTLKDMPGVVDKRAEN